MDIAIIADDQKRELMIQFCIAYCGILAKHTLCATVSTGKYLETTTGLKFERILSDVHGGSQQITSRVSFDEIDLVLMFRDPGTINDESKNRTEMELLRMCDMHNVPIATNIATAEVLVCALDRGDLDWREVFNPRSEYNKRRKIHKI